MQEFSELYKLKIKIFIEEFFSIVSTPYLLWFVFPARAHRIVEYIQQYSVLNDCGHVCNNVNQKNDWNRSIPLNDLLEKKYVDIFGQEKDNFVQAHEPQKESVPISMETDPILATPFSSMGKMNGLDDGNKETNTK